MPEGRASRQRRRDPFSSWPSSTGDSVGRRWDTGQEVFQFVDARRREAGRLVVLQQVRDPAQRAGDRPHSVAQASWVGRHDIDVVPPRQVPCPGGHPASLGAIAAAVQQLRVPGRARPASDDGDHVIDLRPAGADVCREQRLAAPGADPVLAFGERDPAAELSGIVIDAESGQRGERLGDSRLNCLVAIHG